MRGFGKLQPQAGVRERSSSPNGLWGESMPINLNVNNVAATVNVPPDMPLLWVVRDILDLKGASFGCGIGLWGAGIVGGGAQVVSSCMTQAGWVGGEPITTIEGLLPDG